LFGGDNINGWYGIGGTVNIYSFNDFVEVDPPKDFDINNTKVQDINANLLDVPF
jgi:hypothetical protein